MPNFIRITPLVLLLLALSNAAAADSASRLNLLLITADDMNADSSGWNGSQLGATPNLDAFAMSAHRFV
ncbi:MAG: hypothetical protein JNK90_04895, partial [Planctomycetaceae bacterium]|nr:hypothetical protein [Planctomycetaceae bacterium]